MIADKEVVYTWNYSEQNNFASTVGAAISWRPHFINCVLHIFHFGQVWILQMSQQPVFLFCNSFFGDKYFQMDLLTNFQQFCVFFLGNSSFVCLRDVSFICIFHCAAVSLWRQNLSARPPETSQFVISGQRWITRATTWGRKEHTTRVAAKYPNNKSWQWTCQIDFSDQLIPLFGSFFHDMTWEQVCCHLSLCCPLDWHALSALISRYLLWCVRPNVLSRSAPLPCIPLPICAARISGTEQMFA